MAQLNTETWTKRSIFTIPWMKTSQFDWNIYEGYSWMSNWQIKHQYLLHNGKTISSTNEVWVYIKRGYITWQSLLELIFWHPINLFQSVQVASYQSIPVMRGMPYLCVHAYLEWKGECRKTSTQNRQAFGACGLIGWELFSAWMSNYITQKHWYTSHIHRIIPGNLFKWKGPQGYLL